MCSNPSRFIINLPEEEKKELLRICYQVELAHWFYLDFYSQEHNLPNISGRDFLKIIFHHIPFLKEHAERSETIFESWRKHKRTVPTYGAIILNSTLEKVLLVQGYWAKSSWGFPKGKLNENEQNFNCAIREVREETGFDISKIINQEEYIEHTLNEQTIRLYIIPGVSEETKFQPQTRKEIKVGLLALLAQGNMCN
ncbi:DCP2 [Cordylochernes scorpioides]|uniref:DCP2 n=1 Tax=Cordylochernes scorpioides TaxID=51811 RepID=A0ABY6KVU7_9ARAC|nr:DCP2 [Cordylochernes scorpioides]